MKAGPVEIGALLQNRNRYCVPIYQRHYVWNREKQWEPFWQDIRTKAIEPRRQSVTRRPRVTSIAMCSTAIRT